MGGNGGRWGEWREVGGWGEWGQQPIRLSHVALKYRSLPSSSQANLCIMFMIFEVDYEATFKQHLWF